mgnify:CR=1 FL=1
MRANQHDKIMRTLFLMLYCIHLTTKYIQVERIIVSNYQTSTLHQMAYIPVRDIGTETDRLKT